MNLPQILRTMLRSQPPLDEVVAVLREFRKLGGTQAEVMAVLEQLRAEARDEATEDVVLDMMDIASGFCAAQLRVW